ncbi:MAG: hypothetical protein JNL74_24410 [Fibrobacteres bacterium]|nr:hypothetical protein [Fibrobacterota bacterium]
MPIVRLRKHDYWSAEITWSTPRKWYRIKGYTGVNLPVMLKNKYGIYKFEGHYENGNKLLYIGIAYCQNFDTRLHQSRNNLKYLKASNITVSTGQIDLGSFKYTRKRFEEIEKILIYFMEPHLNIKKTIWCPHDCFFEIINSGKRGLLPKRIVYPVANISYMK